MCVLLKKQANRLKVAMLFKLLKLYFLASKILFLCYSISFPDSPSPVQGRSQDFRLENLSEFHVGVLKMDRRAKRTVHGFFPAGGLVCLWGGGGGGGVGVAVSLPPRSGAAPQRLSNITRFPKKMAGVFLSILTLP